MTNASAQITANIQPAATLREEDGFVLGIFKSSMLSIKYSSHIVRRQGDRIRDHFNDGIEGETGEKMIGWMQVPFSDNEVEAMMARAERKAEIEAAGALEGDPEDHIAFVCETTRIENRAIGARRAMINLHARLDDDIDGPRLPEGDNASLVKLRNVRTAITKWMQDGLDDVEAFDAVRLAIR